MLYFNYQSTLFLNDTKIDENNFLILPESIKQMLDKIIM